MRFRPANCQL
ncbi:Protein of unknown function [Lactobacillus helveticus CIRM-BIA 104]|uniref:Uncharacterized protein n=1 Tax=Lactobacillus helveticus CIRM-BIA 104 TaxID=1226333 RepID=U6FAR2_LACHE|nr:Protein of unknown function [Lactobacillus helveticus CIRM-BIA 104]